MADARMSLPDAFPALGNDVFVTIAAQLELLDVANGLAVSRAWQAVLDATEPLWLGLCQSAWASKVYVPQSLRVMAEGAAAVARAQRTMRDELTSLKIRELKDKMRRLRIQSSGAELIEKGDFVDAIMSAERSSLSTSTQKLLCQPSLLARPGETLPKAALRLSFEDAKRTAVSAPELLSCTFHLRLRNDGPLAVARVHDPWWQGKGCGEARFYPDGSLKFAWPEDPDRGGTPMDPFAAMGMPDVSFGWSLEMAGRVVQILFDTRPGPQEIVCRHPTTWGWVLYSQGTCWTSWQMPPCRDEMCSDPLLREEALRHLPSGVRSREF